VSSASFVLDTQGGDGDGRDKGYSFGVESNLTVPVDHTVIQDGYHIGSRYIWNRGFITAINKGAAYYYYYFYYYYYYYY
jgi:hypothetical protein